MRFAVVFALAFGAVFPAFPQVPAPGTVFSDCAECPEMVVVPSGSFVMGSSDNPAAREGPRRTVTIAYSLAVGRHEVTRGQYARFIRDSGYTPAAGNCWYWHGDEGRVVNDDPSKSWQKPGLAQDDDHPVVCVSWNDAKAFAAWLSRKTGRSYRLLTEAEWEYAARAGSAASRPWGDDPVQVCKFANVGDLARSRIVPPGKGKQWPFWNDCDDGFGYTAPVGRFTPNRWGIYDMIGNVWEWTEDCWNESYAGAPSDGGTRLTGDCTRRAARGASWLSGNPHHARPAERIPMESGMRRDHLGFRIARKF